MQRRQKQKIFVWITGTIGIILIIIYIGFYLQQRRFKSYENEKHGFSIKYPASWTFKENQDQAAVIFYAPKSNELDVFQENVNIVVQRKNPLEIELKEYSKLAVEQMKLVFNDNIEIIESEPYTFGKEPGHRFIYYTLGTKNTVQFMHVWALKGDFAYQLTFITLDTYFDDYISDINRMVKSFRIN